MGDPVCYLPNNQEGHGLKLTREQVTSRQVARVAVARERLQDAELALEYLRSGGEYSEDLSDDTDPWG
jgi:hypothetical protein